MVEYAVCTLIISCVLGLKKCEQHFFTYRTETLAYRANMHVSTRGEPWIQLYRLSLCSCGHINWGLSGDSVCVHYNCV